MNIYEISSENNILNLNLEIDLEIDINIYNEDDIKDKLLEISNEIFSILGPDLSESVYHNSIKCELREQNIKYNSEVTIPVIYKENTVGTIRPDLILNGNCVLELKSIPTIKKKELNQLKMYLRLTNYKFGFIINFPNSPKTKIEMYLIIK